MNGYSTNEAWTPESKSPRQPFCIRHYRLGPDLEGSDAVKNVTYPPRGSWHRRRLPTGIDSASKLTNGYTPRPPLTGTFTALSTHFAVLFVYFDVLSVYFEIVYSGPPDPVFGHVQNAPKQAESLPPPFFNIYRR